METTWAPYGSEINQRVLFSGKESAPARATWSDPNTGTWCLLLSLLTAGKVGGRRVLSQIRAWIWHQPRLCLLLIVGRGQRPFPCESGFIQGRGLQGRCAVALPPRIHLSPSRCESAGHSGGLADWLPPARLRAASRPDMGLGTLGESSRCIIGTVSCGGHGRPHFLCEETLTFFNWSSHKHHKPQRSSV